jgi:N4-gp56 family major capsid protein
MATGQIQTGDISNRTAAYVVADLLERANAHVTLGKFGKLKPLPKNETKSITFRRYEHIPIDTTSLVEGVTPAAVKLTYTDYTATISQYGKRIEISDVVMDTHQDPILSESKDVLADQAMYTMETLRYNKVKAGSNVLYSNGTQRTDVNTALSLAVLRKAIRALERQDAKRFTSILKSSANYDTHPVQASYWAVVHPDLRHDIEDIPGFVGVEKYGAGGAVENEIGAVNGVRFVWSTLFTAFADGGGAASGNYVSTTGTSADVYPVLIFGKDAWFDIPLTGTSIVPMVVNPKPSDSDPMGQRGHVSVKYYWTGLITNDSWMIRIEVAASEPS